MRTLRMPRCRRGQPGETKFSNKTLASRDLIETPPAGTYTENGMAPSTPGCVAELRCRCEGLRSERKM